MAVEWAWFCFCSDNWWLCSPGNNNNNAYAVNNNGNVNDNNNVNNENGVRPDLLSIARNKLQVVFVCAESKGTVTRPSGTKIAVGRVVAEAIIRKARALTAHEESNDTGRDF